MTDFATILSDLQAMREEMENNSKIIHNELQELTGRLYGRLEDSAFARELTVLRNQHLDSGETSDKVSDDPAGNTFDYIVKLRKDLTDRLEDVDWEDPDGAFSLIKTIAEEFTELYTKDIMRCVRNVYVRKNNEAKTSSITADKWKLDRY